MAFSRSGPPSSTYADAAHFFHFSGRPVLTAERNGPTIRGSINVPRSFPAPRSYSSQCGKDTETRQAMQGLLVHETATRTEPLDERRASPRSSWWSNLGLVLVLCVLAATLRLYLVWRTEVAARDSIGYIRYAWQLGHRPWADVLRDMEQPPLYALSVLAMSAPVHQVFQGPESTAMQLSAQ